MEQWLDGSPPTNVAWVRITRSGVLRGLSLFLVLLLNLRALGFRVFLPPQDPTLRNSNSIWKQWT